MGRLLRAVLSHVRIPGSTAFPKPIVMTNRRLNEHILSPCFSEVDLAGRVISMHTLPMFHVMGMLMTTWAVRSFEVHVFHSTN